MPVINAAPTTLPISGSCPWQTHNALTTQPAFNVLGILAHHQPVANQMARRQQSQENHTDLAN
jgi:hypothetical protein